MAIKIQGTTVVDDSRELQNIQSIDATTLAALEAAGVGGGVEVSDTAPSSPSEGDLWWDSTSGTLKVYYDDGDSQQWVDASPTLSSDFTEDVYEPPFDFDAASFGDTACGGIYMGQISAAGQCYALIVAPNATGCDICEWKTTNTTTAGTDSLVDGFANTYGPLDNAEHPAGNWCATRTINGFSDWYLPAIDELETFYNNGASVSNETVIGTGEAFASTYYWSSTEDDAFYGCRLTFLDGNRLITPKVFTSRLRAVRREPI